jgi:hypothetical protein
METNLDPDNYPTQLLLRAAGTEDAERSVKDVLGSAPRMYRWWKELRFPEVDEPGIVGPGPLDS